MDIDDENRNSDTDDEPTLEKRVRDVDCAHVYIATAPEKCFLGVELMKIVEHSW